MSGKMKKEEQVLLELLKQALKKKPEGRDEQPPVTQREETRQKEQTQELTQEQWEQLIAFADKHAVLPLLYEELKGQTDLAEALFLQVETVSRRTVKKSYRLLFLNKYITELLGEEGIKAITLKGAVTASLYPVPELRKSGDVDILVTGESDYLRACQLLEVHGFLQEKEQKTLHHMEFTHPEGISVELHRILAEPFDSERTNLYLQGLLPAYEEHAQVNDYWGIALYEPSGAYHAFYLILHMLQHFLRAGFGLKNLCDWVVFWERDIEKKEQEQFVRLIKESRTEGFVSILTAACIRYLGLSGTSVAFFMEREVPQAVVEEFMEEILEAEEFGKSGDSRMVVLRDTGFAAYVREFHHQMRLNFSKSGRVILLWPALWLVTLFRFVRNNRKIRNITSMDILKKAGKRSRLTKHMKLFQ